MHFSFILHRTFVFHALKSSRGNCQFCLKMARWEAVPIYAGTWRPIEQAGGLENHASQGFHAPAATALPYGLSWNRGFLVSLQPTRWELKIQGNIIGFYRNFKAFSSENPPLSWDSLKNIIWKFSSRNSWEEELLCLPSWNFLNVKNLSEGNSCSWLALSRGICVPRDKLIKNSESKHILCSELSAIFKLISGKHMCVLCLFPVLDLGSRKWGERKATVQIAALPSECSDTSCHSYTSIRLLLTPLWYFLVSHAPNARSFVIQYHIKCFSEINKHYMH